MLVSQEVFEAGQRSTSTPQHSGIRSATLANSSDTNKSRHLTKVSLNLLVLRHAHISTPEGVREPFPIQYPPRSSQSEDGRSFLYRITAYSAFSHDY